MKKILTICLAAMLLAACDTEIPEYILPHLETLAATDVTAEKAVLHGTMKTEPSGHSYVRRCFDISLSEDMSDAQRLWCDEEPVMMMHETMNDISLAVKGFSPLTTYYYRVCIEKDRELSEPIYGQVMSFKTTNSSTPEPTEKGITVVTNEPYAVTSSTAIVGGSCTVKNCTLARFGLLISVSKTEPTLSSTDDVYDAGTTNTSFSVQCLDIPSAKTYYVRVFAVDSESNEYYGEVKSFTTKSEAGGSLTVNDFIGTYTLKASSPWESKDVTWSDVQIIPYNGDTVIAVGFEGKDALRALGVFSQGLQVIRFESDWYFEAFSFTYNSKNCVSIFMPVEYNSSDKKAYLLDTGGRNGRGEIWLTKTGTNTYGFAPCDGATFDGKYANGFVFDYYSLSDWEKRGNSETYINATMTRTAATTTKAKPARVYRNTKISAYEKQDNHNVHIVSL